MIKSYNKNTLISSLPIKPYCSNNLQFGLRIRDKENAITHKYIQMNDNSIKFLLVDCDHTNTLIWEDNHLAPPNFTMRNKENGHFHLLWALSDPIFKDYINKKRNLNYYAKIEQAYTEGCLGDLQYINLIAKNPLHEFWDVWQTNHFYAYSLDELADYVDLPKKITKKQALGEGRNCWLFETVRKWAYKQVLFYQTNGAKEIDFYNVVLNKLEKLNIFEHSRPLEFSEIKAIAKSISKWTWQHFSASKFSEIQSKRSQKRTVIKNNQQIITELVNEFSHTTS